MKIWAMTLTWNGLDRLKKLRPGLLENTSRYDFKWLVKDNGSQDGTVEELKTWDEVKLIETSHNRDNFAKGMNILFESVDIADDDLLLFLNNDIIFRNSKSISDMVKLLDKASVDLVGARMCYENTNKLQHAGVVFTNHRGVLPLHFRRGDVSDSNSEKNRYFKAVTAACAITRASTWRQVGGMDEKFVWAFEDIDYCLKVDKLKPNNVAYCGTTDIWHEESSSLKKNPVNKMFMGPNCLYFHGKWAGIEPDQNDYYTNTGRGVIK